MTKLSRDLTRVTNLTRVLTMMINGDHGALMDTSKALITTSQQAPMMTMILFFDDKHKEGKHLAHNADPSKLSLTMFYKLIEIKIN